MPNERVCRTEERLADSFCFLSFFAPFLFSSAKFAEIGKIEIRQNCKAKTFECQTIQKRLANLFYKAGGAQVTICKVRIFLAEFFLKKLQITSTYKSTNVQTFISKKVNRRLIIDSHKWSPLNFTHRRFCAHAKTNRLQTPKNDLDTNVISVGLVERR